MLRNNGIKSYIATGANDGFGKGRSIVDAQRMTVQKRRFGERLRFLRELRGWQLEALAERIGKSASTISRIENGKQNLTMLDILALAQALEISPSHLFGHIVEESTSVEFPGVKRSAQRCANKGKEAIQILTNLVNDLEVFASL